MEFHLTRGLRLQTDPEHKNLYKWAINEIDQEGRVVGRDQIPWPWTLNFTATSCSLGDSLEIKTKAASDAREVEQRQHIRIKLRPGTERDDENFFRRTTYSMFGSDRAIKDFQLDIYPITDPATQQESCSAWGSVSYTSEIDFRKETTDDCIGFYMYVKPETFGRYAAKIAHGLVDEIVLSLRSVSGFYSDWSPSISTNSVKVLTEGSEQNVAMPPQIQFELPRLGAVWEAQLYINRRLEFNKPGAAEEAEERTEVGAAKGNQEAPAQAPVVGEPRLLKMLGSLRKAAWVIVTLLALIFVSMLQR